MMTLWKNYKSTILLLAGILIGGLLGWFLPASAAILGPVGQIFMNLLFVMIVPLVFFSVSSSICNLSKRSALGKTLGVTVAVMLGLMLLLALISYVGCLIFPPVDAIDVAVEAVQTAEQHSVGELIVNALTVSDFAMLFSVKHILPLMVIAILFGWAVARLKMEKVSGALEVCNQIVMQMMECLMLVAPLGLGCYFAEMTANSGSMLMSGFGRVFMLYIVLSALAYVFIDPLIAMFALGAKGWSAYWRAIIKPSLMAVSTLSSSACMPANIQAAKQMGADEMLAESVVPLGTQLFKQGSVISCVTKVAFVMLLIGQNMATPESLLVMIAVSILASVVVGAVPTGAGTAELFICSILGADPSFVGLLIVISTIVDMPGTLLNVSGNAVLPLAVNRFVGNRK